MLIPLWFIVGVAGHLSNAGSFLIDKMLLRRSFKRPATYAGVIGALGVLAIVLLPFGGVHWPDAAGWAWIAIAGSTFVLALWSFFAALAEGETSRVVPVIGSLVPILTLGGTAALLGERLSTAQLFGFGILVLATAILSGGPAHTRLNKRAILLAILAAAFFAVASVTAKITYDGYGFVTAFFWSRFWGVATAVGILMYDPEAGREFWEALFPDRKTRRKKKGSRGGHKAVAAFFVGQSLGSIGFVGVQYAISLGSAAIVTSLQAVQYAFLVIAALLLKKRAHLLGEDLNHRTILRKTVAIALVAVGLWLVVL